MVGQNTGPSPSPNPCSNPNTGSGYMNSQQSLLNQQLMGKKQTLQRQIMEQKQQLLLQQQMLVDAVKLSPNVYCADLLAQQREFIISHFYLSPSSLCLLTCQRQGCPAVREVSSIRVKCFRGKKFLIYQLLDSWNAPPLR